MKQMSGQSFDFLARLSCMKHIESKAFTFELCSLFIVP